MVAFDLGLIRSLTLTVTDLPLERFVTRSMLPIE